MGYHIDYATNETHGPFRKVTGIDYIDHPDHEVSVGGKSWTRPGWRARVEILECGHHGKTVNMAWPYVPPPAKKRRCLSCGQKMDEEAALAQREWEANLELSPPRRGHLRLVTDDDG